MEKKKDLRIIRTDKTLVNAFYDLLRTNAVENISISLLCDNALVNRATFYKHFTDKKNFLDFCIFFKIREIKKALAIEDTENVSEFFADRLLEVLTLLAKIEKLNPENTVYFGKNLKILCESIDRNLFNAFSDFYEMHPVSCAGGIGMLCAGQSGAIVGIATEYIKDNGILHEEECAAIAGKVRGFLQNR